MKIEELKTLCVEDKIKWSLHAMKRLRERKISIDDFINCKDDGACHQLINL